MSKNHKISSITLYTLMAITVIVVAIFFMGGNVDEAAEMKEPIYTDLLLWWTYITVGFGIVVTLGFGLFQFIIQLKDHPKSALKSLAVLVGFAAILGISWMLGDGTPLNIQGYDGPDNVYVWLKAADMFFYTIYFMGGVALLAILSSSVLKMIRK